MSRLPPITTPLYQIGDVLTSKTNSNLTRTITAIKKNYNYKMNKWGYAYLDSLGHTGISSQEHLKDWAHIPVIV